MNWTLDEVVLDVESRKAEVSVTYQDGVFLGGAISPHDEQEAQRETSNCRKPRVGRKWIIRGFQAFNGHLQGGRTSKNVILGVKSSTNWR